MTPELIVLALLSGVAPIRVPPGKKIRVVAVSASINPDSDLDQAMVTFARSGQTIAQTATNPLADSMVNLAAGIGVPENAPAIVSQTVATGVNVWSQLATVATCGLPDIWLPWDFTITVQLAVGTVGNGIVLYERADA